MWILPFNLKTKTEPENLIGVGNLSFDNRPALMWAVRVTLTKSGIVKLYLVSKENMEGGEEATDKVIRTRAEITTTSSDIVVRPNVTEKDLLKVYYLEAGEIHTLLNENDGLRMPGETYLVLSIESEEEGRVMGEFVWDETTPVK